MYPLHCQNQQFLKTSVDCIQTEFKLPEKGEGPKKGLGLRRARAEIEGRLI